jgi:flagellar L-ring protein FlgH
MERERSMRREMGILVGLALCLYAGTCSADSLWREAPRGFLFSDVRASRLGDVVTVLVVESSSTDRKAETNLKKDSTNGFTLPNFFGNTTLFGGSSNGGRAKFDFSGNNEQKANGNITRSDNVTASIPARVVKVLDNGLLVVEGRRGVVVNDETQTLAFSGVVRPEDITPDNKVLSTQVADAEVTVVGKGILADKQHPGILQTIFDYFKIF